MGVFPLAFAPSPSNTCSVFSKQTRGAGSNHFFLACARVLCVCAGNLRGSRSLPGGKPQDTWAVSLCCHQAAAAGHFPWSTGSRPYRNWGGSTQLDPVKATPNAWPGRLDERCYVHCASADVKANCTCYIWCVRKA